VFNDQGEYAGVRASNRDITKLRIAEREAREYRETLAQLDRAAMLGQLAGSIAHELNQPLTGILSSAQAGELLIEQGNADTIEIGEILTDIIDDAKRSAEVIRNLRNLFGRQKTEFKVIDLKAQIEETLRILNSEFVIHNVAVRTDFCGAPPAVMANGIQIQQVLINLISNAIQAMQQSAKGIRSISIITATGNGREIQVQVEDSGPGIDPEQLKDIFEPLTTSKKGGLGMGLSISRSIVQAHGGRIWAENIPPGGARISFMLPALEKKS
jgi:C4-dicarboxylate-specific signal transduction histidine kinase